MWKLTRRSWLRATGLGSLAGSLAAGSRLAGQQAHNGGQSAGAHQNHAMGTVGHVATDGVDPTAYLRAWNFSNLPPNERAEFYRETPRPDVRTCRWRRLWSRTARF